MNMLKLKNNRNVKIKYKDHTFLETHVRGRRVTQIRTILEVKGHNKLRKICNYEEQNTCTLLLSQINKNHNKLCNN